MRISYDMDYTGNEIKIIYRENGEFKRMTTIQKGDTLSIQPDNPARKKNRGRQVIVRDFSKDETGYPVEAIVTFTDTQRTGNVDLKDLAAI